MLTLSGTVVADGQTEYGQVRIVGDRLAFGSPPPKALSSSAEQSDPENIVEGWIFPGLVDVHCHIGLLASGEVDGDAATAKALTTVHSGVLLVRDAGSPVDMRFLGDNPGVPRIIRAGRHIARPKRYHRNFAVDLENPSDLAAEAGIQALAGDGWVKLVGDWIDRDLGAEADLRPLWTSQQLREAFLAVHNNGARVMVHTFAEESVDDLLDARVDGIEHGTGMNSRQIERAAQAGVAVTPTLMQVENFPVIAAHAEEKYPLYGARMRMMYERRNELVRNFYDAGIQLLVGTDAGGGIGHGNIGTEAKLLVDAGVPPEAVVAAATWEARTYLGAPGISEGAPADVVVFPEDPRVNIDVLAHPSAVFLGGKRVR